MKIVIKNKKKQPKAKKASKSKISPREARNIFIYSLITFIFAMLIGGLIGLLPDRIYIWKIPLDLQEGFWAIATVFMTLLIAILGVKAYQN